MLRDILKGGDPQIEAVAAQITAANADIIALQGFDYDLENTALKAFADLLNYPHIFTLPPNAGRMTPLDLDGNGKTGEPRDAQGYGRFFGQGSMAILARYPILTDEVQDFSEMLWRDMPGALLPELDGQPFPSAKALDIQRLSSNGHWVVPVTHPTFGRVAILTYHATPPVFDGPEDRNGKRNHDETAFWGQYLDGVFGSPPTQRFVILGDANLDPNRGDGIRTGMQYLLRRPALQDPLPGQPTVSFSQTGPMRVDYVLPSADWSVENAQVMVSDPIASRHSLVWADLKP